jgi:hypothetical protein
MVCRKLFRIYAMQISPSDGGSSSRLGCAGGLLRIQPPIIDRALRKINREWLSLGGFEVIM